MQAQREGIACCGTTPTQCTLLTEIGRNGAMTLAALSRRAGLDKGWTSRAVEALVQEGLLTKVPSPNDRRTVSIDLSAEGKARFEQLDRTLNRQAERVMTRIPAQERAQVTRALELLRAALRAEAEGGPRLEFRKALPGDWPAIAALLSAARLPLDGVRDHLPGFLLAFRGDVLAGTAALERYGDVALLRSVAVAEEARGTGLGQELVHRILDEAGAGGILTVALLTTTAERFFPRFGFRQVDRCALPKALQCSAELQGACPASSVPMLLTLRAGRQENIRSEANGCS